MMTANQAATESIAAYAVSARKALYVDLGSPRRKSNSRTAGQILQDIHGCEIRGCESI
jgi:hypothetical protein